MSETEDDNNKPKYSATSFLFGNVNENAELEDEYLQSSELKHLNNFENCRVTEIEETCKQVLLEEGNSSSDNASVTKTSNIEAKDYYDEADPLIDPDIDLQSLDYQIDVQKPHDNDEDNYDEEPNNSDSLKPPSSSPSPQVKSAADIKLDPDSEANSDQLMPPPSQMPVKQLLTCPIDTSSLCQASKDGNKKGLNTPLANLMPDEYEDIPISEIFPEFNPNETPKWMRLFKLNYPPQYLRDVQDQITQSHYTDRFWKPSPDDDCLILDNTFNLGLISEKRVGEKIIDEASELCHPVPYNSTVDSITQYMAGHPNSWWCQAYKKIFEGKYNEAMKYVKYYNFSAQQKATKSSRKGANKFRDNIETKNESKLGLSFDYFSDVPAATWRNGPAKYWYDQLNIPEDVDVTMWKDWNLNQSNNQSSIVNTSILTNDIVDEKKTDQVIEPIKLTNNDDQPIVKKEKNPKDSDVDLDISLEVVDQVVPTVVEEGENVVEKSIDSDEGIELDEVELYRDSLMARFDESSFYPYQIIQWEDDIIYDVQSAKTKIEQMARTNAAYAGWIPTKNCRTMAAFLDFYAEKYPAIIPSKTLFSNTCSAATIQQNNSSASSNTAKWTNQRNPGGILQNNATQNNYNPFSIFPIENEGILTDSWLKNIIYDSEEAAKFPPFLLTYDENDEACYHEEAIPDAELAAIALAAVDNPSANQIASRYGLSDAVLRELVTNTSSAILENHEAGLTGPDGKLTTGGGSAGQNKQPINRASLHVSFGFASTKGMLTGALAKAAKGAEKVKRILGKHGFLAKEDSNADEDDVTGEGGDDSLQNVAAAANGLPPKDSFNMSNDDFYAQKVGPLDGTQSRCGPLQHSTPAVELWPPFFPTYMTSLRLQQFHRVPLKKYLRGPMSQYNSPFSIFNLTKTIQKKAREREDEKAACGGGDIFFMRTPADLSGIDGDLVLFEFSEEYPPFVQQTGMATRVVNYYRSLTPKDPNLSPAHDPYTKPPELPFGSLVYVSSAESPFLGNLRCGAYLQTLENNMFRAPIYSHSLSQTDFIIIRNRNGLSIRKTNAIFTVGQLVPLIEVPSPNSKRANNFVRDFLQVYILRLFLRSTDEPKRIKMEEIRKAFPNHSESSVRKRLKICADFRRTGSDASWWVLRPDYRLPSEEEVRYLVSPEDCCAHYSMLASEMRLKEAGYGEKYLFVADENQNEDEEGQPKLEDEVKAAPWNTTRAYLAAQRGGCFLELHGAADPTGLGEAFSYSKTSAKPGALFRQSGGEIARSLLKGKKTVTGTDADLRKLSLKEARALLRSYGINEADLKSFKRWEIIDMVRFTSTERAKQGEEEDTAKFARGNRLSMTEQVRCYREECQRIFDLQNRVLSNPELLSSDEQVSSEEEEDDQQLYSSQNESKKIEKNSAIGGVKLSTLSSGQSLEQMSKNMQSYLSNRITAKDLSTKEEEAERERLKKQLSSTKQVKTPKKTPSLSALTKADPSSIEPPTNTESSSTVVAGSASATTTVKPANEVFEANSENAGNILDLPVPFDGAQKKILRIKRIVVENGEKIEKTEIIPWGPVAEIYLKIRQTRDNDFINNFVGNDDQIKEQQRKEKRRLQDQLRRLKKQEQMRNTSSGRETSNSNHPRTPSQSNSKSLASSQFGNPSSSSSSAVKKRRNRPITEALSKMRCGACGQIGHMRTNKECPMYSQSGTKNKGQFGIRGTRVNTAAVLEEASLDQDSVAAAQELTLKPISELLAEQNSETARSDEGANESSAPERENLFGSGDDSLTDDDSGNKQNKPNELKFKIKKQLLDRLTEASQVVQSANAVVAAYKRRMSNNKKSMMPSAADEDYPTQNVKHRGNRRRIDPAVALNHLLEGIYKDFTQFQGYKIFLHPVKEKEYPNYYEIIKNPMDLSQIRTRINSNQYTTREEFLSDIRLIYSNSVQFNGRYSSLTESAQKMCSHTMEQFAEKEQKLMRLESLINPLMDEDDLVGLSYLLQHGVEVMRNVDNSRPFHFPVDKRRYPEYYKKIQKPMDLSTLENKVKQTQYQNREEFLADAMLILTNCIDFNGEDSSLTKIATVMLEEVQKRLEEDKETLDTLESNILNRIDEVSLSDGGSYGDPKMPRSLSSTGGGGIKRKHSAMDDEAGEGLMADDNEDDEEDGYDENDDGNEELEDEDDEDLEDDTNDAKDVSYRPGRSLNSMSASRPKRPHLEHSKVNRKASLSQNKSLNFIDNYSNAHDEDVFKANPPTNIDDLPNMFDDIINETDLMGGELLASQGLNLQPERSMDLANDLQLSDSEDDDEDEDDSDVNNREDEDVDNSDNNNSKSVNFFIGESDNDSNTM